MNEELKEAVITDLEKGYIPLFKETPMKIIFDRLVNEFNKVAIYSKSHRFLGRVITIYGKREIDEETCKAFHGAIYKGFCIFREVTIFEKDCPNLFQNEERNQI